MADIVEEVRLARESARRAEAAADEARQAQHDCAQGLQEMVERMERVEGLARDSVALSTRLVQAQEEAWKLRRRCLEGTARAALRVAQTFADDPWIRRGVALVVVVLALGATGYGLIVEEGRWSVGAALDASEENARAAEERRLRADPVEDVPGTPGNAAPALDP